MPETSSGSKENVLNCGESDANASTSSSPSSPAANTASVFRYPRQLLPTFNSFKTFDNPNIIYPQKSSSLSNDCNVLTVSNSKISLINLIFNVLLLLLFFIVYLSQNSRIYSLEHRIDELERVTVIWVSCIFYLKILVAMLRVVYLPAFFDSHLNDLMTIKKHLLK